MIYDWMTNIDISSLILGTVLGTVTSTWHNYYVKRPKLQINGSGSGSGTFHYNSITVTNSPGLLGLRLPETIIFGRYIHGSIEKGLVVDRSPAHQCRAWIYDKQTNQPISLLWWQAPDHKMTQVVTLNSGESANLMIFARLHDEPLKYFVYQLKDPSRNELEVPNDAAKFDSTREFFIEIQHSYGKKKFRIGCKMTRGFDERLNYSWEGGGGSF